MFLKVTASQVKFMLRQKNARIVFYILLVMILTNFISNVLMFQGMDVIKYVSSYETASFKLE